MNNQDIKNALLSILFVAGDAVNISDLAVSLEASEAQILKIAGEIEEENSAENSGILIKKLPQKLQLCSNPVYASYVEKALAPVTKSKLSQSLLETLAIIAYRQPITRIEIEQVRGVACNYSLATLIERGLIERSGKKKTLGNPTLYTTSDEFMRHFGIGSLDELPNLKLAE